MKMEIIDEFRHNIYSLVSTYVRNGKDAKEAVDLLKEVITELEKPYEN